MTKGTIELFPFRGDGSIIPTVEDLINIRASLKLPLRKVAAATGVSISTISRIERGREANFSNWQVLCDYYEKENTVKIPAVIELGNYIFLYKGEMTTENWLDSRKDGVGGSDLSVLLGVNPWASEARVFFEKLNMVEGPDLNSNSAVYWGKKNEDTILDATQYFDFNNKDAYMVNDLVDGKRVRSHIEFPFIAINKKLPWLRMNVDGFIYHDLNVTTDTVIRDMINGILPKPDGVAEIKTISGMSRDRWEGGIPYGYVCQVTGYVTVLLDLNPDLYGAIFSLVDGAQLTYHAIEWNDDLVERVVHRSYEFWQKVLEGREVIAKYGTGERAEEELWKIAPDPDSSEDYSKFLSQSYLWKLDNPTKYVDDDELLNAANLYQHWNKLENEAKAEKQLNNNRMKQAMVLHGSNKLQIKRGEEAVAAVSFNKRIYVKIFDN
jgi:predicted phage-related endonuclease